MGPHSFKCGKEAVGEYSEKLEELLQWGRTLSSAERGASALMNVKFIRSFNGAALFQVRKVNIYAQYLRNLRRLQWGRTLSSAESKEQLLKRL